MTNSPPPKKDPVPIHGGDANLIDSNTFVLSIRASTGDPKKGDIVNIFLPWNIIVHGRLLEQREDGRWLFEVI